MCVRVSDCGMQVEAERLGRLPCQIAAEVRYGDGEGEFNIERWVPPELTRHTRPFIHYALAAGEMALNDAGWSAESAGVARCNRAGVCVGTGMVDLQAVLEAGDRLSASYRKLSPFFIPSILGNMPAGHLSIQHGLRGPNHAPTTACTTGAHAIGDAANLILLGQADMMLAGATEASVHELALAGFGRAQALATGFNHTDEDQAAAHGGKFHGTPEDASRPFSAGRTGFVMGEGAGMMVLEDYDAAIARGVDPETGIYAELKGYGSSADGFHITSPAPDGSGATRAMRAALRNAVRSNKLLMLPQSSGFVTIARKQKSLACTPIASAWQGLSAADVDYVNAHATSTPMGDGLECAAIASVFGCNEKSQAQRPAGPVAVSSTKGAVGHLLGAAGAVEAIFTVLAVKHQRCPPTVNLTRQSVDESLLEHAESLSLLMAEGGPGAEAHMHAEGAETKQQVDDEGMGVQMRVRSAMTNSFGFGGTNATLVFTEPPHVRWQ